MDDTPQETKHFAIVPPTERHLPSALANVRSQIVACRDPQLMTKLAEIDILLAHARAICETWGIEV